MNNQIPKQMHGILLKGHGGIEQLEFNSCIDTPKPNSGEVLIKVGACGVNNTDINTRIGWYSKAIKDSTNTGGKEGFTQVNDDDASWSGVALKFPFIQGADCCGTIVAVGNGVSESRIGERVLVRTMQEPLHSTEAEAFQCITYGSECNGGFAEYAVARSSESFAITSSLSDAELASFPCAYSTAENMIERAKVSASDRVLITGASGGVGSAAVQLAKRRGAHVIAVSGKAKHADVLDLGADQVLERGQPLLENLDKESIDVVIDIVAGPQWPELCDVLVKGGRYAVAGAIAGPLVDLDVRSLYLKDLTFLGCTWQPLEVMQNLVRYIEQGEIKPVVSKTYPLSNIAEAQTDFINKTFTGKLVLLP